MQKIVIINGVRVEVDLLEITENKGEELDFGIMRIPFSNKPQNFQIGDEVKIFINDDETLLEYDAMVILSDKVTKVTRYEDIYTHEITFIEAVKKYEKILNANIAISQPISGTKNTLSDVIDKINNKVPFERTSFHGSTRLFSLNSDLRTYCDTIEAPQFFFEKKSLRSMLNDVASFTNAIARIEDTDTTKNELIFDFYNEFLLLTTNLEEDIVSWELNADFRNFGTTVDMELQNVVMSDDIDRGAIVFPSTNDWIAPRATTNVLGDETYEFRLDQTKPIFEFGEVKVLINYNNGTTTSLTEFDFTDRVVNKERWDRLPTDASTGITRKNGDYKSNTLYWNYGGTTVTNAELFGALKTQNTFENCIRRMLVDLTGNDTGFQSQDLEEFLLRFTYIPYVNEKVRVQKANVNDVGTDFQIYINQGGKLLSGERTIKNAHGYIERVGNDDIKVSKYGTLVNDLLPLGSYFRTVDGTFNEQSGTFVLSKRKISYNIYDMDEEYEFTKSFNRISNFVKIDQEDRQYDVTTNIQIVPRREIYQEYVEMDVNPDTNNTIITPFGSETFINTFRSTRSVDETGSLRGRFAPGTADNQSIDFAMFYSSDIYDPDFDINVGTEGLRRSVSKTGEGNTLKFSWEFDTPSKCGDILIDDVYFDGITTQTVQANKNVFYTDENGELDTFYISYHRQADVNPLDTAKLARAKKLPISVIPNNCAFGGHGRNANESSDTFKVVKDRAETLGMTYQIHVVPHWQWVNTFVIGNKAIKDNNLIFELPDNEPLYVWTSDTETYNTSTDNLFAKGTLDTISEYAVGKVGSTYETFTFYLEVDSDVTNGKASWGLADASGNLYIGVNQTDQNVSRVYFNYRNKRENTKYRFDNEEIVGGVAPEMPIDLTFSNLLKTGFTASWVDNSVSSDNFEYNVKDETSTIIQSGTLPITQTDVTISGLTAGQDYTFEVRTIRGGLNSNYASSLVTTEPPIPIAPTNGSITNIQETSFTMNWTDNAEYEDGFRVYVRDNDAGTGFNYFGSVGANVTSKGISGLTNDTSYTIRVYAYNTSEGQLQESTSYAEATATTASPPPPQTVTPSINNVDAGRDNISFTIRNNDGSEAQIKYELNDSTPDITYGNVASGSSTTLIVISGLTPETTYTINATAQASGESLSNTAQYSQRTDDYPAEPTGLLLSSNPIPIALVTISATWNDVLGYSKYDVQLSDTSNFSNILESDTTGYDETSYDFNTLLDEGYTYYVRIRNVDGSFTSDWVSKGISV